MLAVGKGRRGRGEGEREGREGEEERGEGGGKGRKEERGGEGEEEEEERERGGNGREEKRGREEGKGWRREGKEEEEEERRGRSCKVPCTATTLQVALNDIEVSTENVQKLMKELQVREAVTQGKNLLMYKPYNRYYLWCRLSVPRLSLKLGSWQREIWM